MRLFSFFVATALVVALNAQLKRETLGTSYKLPNGLPNGSILTLFFYHFKVGYNSFNDSGPVSIDFYDKDVVDDWTKYDHAHLRIDNSHAAERVVSNTYINGKWRIESFPPQQIDSRPDFGQHWKVDIIKLDSNRMSVYFFGFWSGARTFEKSLDNIRSVYIISNHIDHNNAEIRLTLPNTNIDVPLVLERFGDILVNNRKQEGKRTLTKLPNFPVGSHMEMFALLGASARYHGQAPTLFFSPVGSSHFFVKIVQIPIWDFISSVMHELYITDNDAWTDRTKEMYKDNRNRPAGVKSCTNVMTKPNGDLVHMILKRVSTQEVSIVLLDRGSLTAKIGATCSHTISADLAKMMDEPFEIVGHDGALIFNLEHVIPPTPVNATETNTTMID